MEIIKEIESLKKILTQTNDEEKIEEIKTNIEDLEGQLMTEDYNVAKYLEALNKKVEPLLVCFHPDIRNKILLSIKKDKKTKLEKLQDRNYFSEAQCELVSGMPDNPTDQDTYEELMTMEDKEIKFWDKVGKIPNNMEPDEWEKIRVDYIERMIIERQNGIAFEKEKLDELFKRLELDELRKLEKGRIPVPKEILIYVTIDFENECFISRKWDEKLYDVVDMFKYERDAIERDKWYQLMNNSSDDRYQQWLDYKSEQEEDIETPVEEVSIKNITESISQLKEKIIEVEKGIVIEKEKTKNKDEDDEDEYDPEGLEPEVDGYIPDLQKIDFEIESENPTKIVDDEEDEWNF
jgi:hypothetical protein